MAAVGRELVAAAPGIDRDGAIDGLGGIGTRGRAGRSADDLASGVAGAIEAGRNPVGMIPVSMSGTPFQLEVWEALLGVPAGGLVTYSDLAAAMGRPRAVRAVAAACAANRIGLIVPCHRVVRSDGSLGGYRWGVELKRQIIEAERSPGRTGCQVEGVSTALRAA